MCIYVCIYVCRARWCLELCCAFVCFKCFEHKRKTKNEPQNKKSIEKQTETEPQSKKSIEQLTKKEPQSKKRIEKTNEK